MRITWAGEMCRRDSIGALLEHVPKQGNTGRLLTLVSMPMHLLPSQPSSLGSMPMNSSLSTNRSPSSPSNSPAVSISTRRTSIDSTVIAAAEKSNTTASGGKEGQWERKAGRDVIIYQNTDVLCLRDLGLDGRHFRQFSHIEYIMSLFGSLLFVGDPSALNRFPGRSELNDLRSAFVGGICNLRALQKLHHSKMFLCATIMTCWMCRRTHLHARFPRGKSGIRPIIGRPKHAVSLK